MATETELKLSLHAVDLPRLLAHPLLQAQPPLVRHLRNTYFDTPSQDLMRERIAVRERQIGRRTWLTVKTAGHSAGGLSQRQEWEAPSRAGALNMADIVTDPDLAQRLMAMRSRLVPLFHTHFQRRQWVLVHGQSRIEVALDQGDISTDAGGGRPARRQALLELELELKDGEASDLLDLAHTLSLGPDGGDGPGIWLHPDDRSKAARGLMLFTGQTPQAATATPHTLQADIHPLEAWRSTALACVAQLQANTVPWLEMDPAHAQADPEFVHQARVALRRLRTGLRLFAPWLPRRFAAHWSAVWREAASHLGEPRNWDVLVNELQPILLAPCPPADATRWSDWIHDQREAAHRRARAALENPGHTRALLAFMHGIMALPPARRRDRTTVGAWAIDALAVPHRRLLEQTREALSAGPEARHELRIAVKRLRYATGFLGDLLPASVRRDGLSGLSQVQDRLGHLNDLDQARQMLAACPVADPAPVLAQIEALTREGLAHLPRLERQLLKLPAPR
ncbi:MAG: CYTH and CHAD domain-containing protein [Burkholderiaceae bacterium]